MVFIHSGVLSAVGDGRIITASEKRGHGIHDAPATRRLSVIVVSKNKLEAAEAKDAPALKVGANQHSGISAMAMRHSSTSTERILARLDPTPSWPPG
jgi:hypothetical protein